MQADYHPLDFRTYYISSKTAFNGDNPYNESDQILTSIRENIGSDEWDFKSSPHEKSVYAPQFIWFFGLYNLLDFENAIWVQFTLNIISLLLIAYFINLLNSKIRIQYVLLAIFAFRGTWFALDNGQPMIQCLAMILAGIHLSINTKHKMLAGIILGITGFKFTLLIPVALYLLISKQFKTFATLIQVVVLLNVSALLRFEDTESAFRNWLENMRFLNTYVHQPDTINGLNIISCSISVPLAYFNVIPEFAIKFSFPILYLFSIASTVYLTIKNKIEPLVGLLFLTLCGFCFSQHLFYDLLVPICYLMINKDYEKYLSIPSILLAFTLLIPLGALATKLELPVLNFLVPLLLILVLANWTNTHFFRINKAIKKPN